MPGRQVGMTSRSQPSPNAFRSSSSGCLGVDHTVLELPGVFGSQPLVHHLEWQLAPSRPSINQKRGGPFLQVCRQMNGCGRLANAAFAFVVSIFSAGVGAIVSGLIGAIGSFFLPFLTMT